MQTQIRLPSPGCKLLRLTPAPTLVQPSWLQQLQARGAALVRAWCERRRVARAYREDLRTLARLGERDLADFGAPCWLRADVSRYR